MKEHSFKHKFNGRKNRIEIGRKNGIQNGIKGKFKKTKNVLYGEEEQERECRRRQKEKRTLYFIGLGILGTAMVIIFMQKITGMSFSDFLLPCLFHELTGYYCPGCGGSRAVHYLLEGNIPGSLYYHPFVLYAAAVCAAFMATNTIELLSRGKWKSGMEFKSCYVWIGVVIVALNFIVKNGVLLFTGTAMIP